MQILNLLWSLDLFLGEPQDTTPRATVNGLAFRDRLLAGRVTPCPPVTGRDRSALLRRLGDGASLGWILPFT